MRAGEAATNRLTTDTSSPVASESQTDYSARGLDEKGFVRALTQFVIFEPEGCFSIRRTGSNDEYQAQDLPYAKYPSKPGVVYRAGTEVGGRRCPRCPDFIAVTSHVVRLPRPEQRCWWVHERCYSTFTVDLRDAR